ncbi:MAG: hypothetical protein IMZ53_02985 [Thermoplasmata archaeon]|nr:hypothetical protein [Thermoplasmata archaeon]
MTLQEFYHKYKMRAIDSFQDTSSMVVDISLSSSLRVSKRDSNMQGDMQIKAMLQSFVDKADKMKKDFEGINL